MTKPILEKLGQEYAEKVDFSQEVLEHFHVLGIPIVQALRDGKVVTRVTGAQNERVIASCFPPWQMAGKSRFP